jgi:hypothetical protein
MADNFLRAIKDRDNLQKSHELHRKLTHKCVGCGPLIIVNAAINLLISTLRGTLKKEDALATYDQVCGSGRLLLEDRYNGVMKTPHVMDVPDLGTPH